MKITRSNYESYFLDFLEKNLNPSLTDEFQQFLKENPDLAIELEMGEMISLPVTNYIQFGAKELLKKSGTDQERAFQEQAIAYYEGDLSSGERKDFEASLSENSVKATDAQQFGKLKLETDQTIICENKAQLKKRVILIPLWIQVGSIAAMLLLAYLLFQPYNKIQPPNAKLADNFKSKNPKNIVIPEVKVKAEQQVVEKMVPVVTPKPIPAKIPAKNKQSPADQQPEKAVAPLPQFRTPAIAPSLLQPHGISFGMPEDVGLAVMTLKDPVMDSKEVELSELLKVHLAAMRHSDDRKLLSTDHLGLSGLQLVARLTGKRLTARQGDDGIVRSVSYNSHLLAFSIPVNR